MKNKNTLLPCLLAMILSSCTNSPFMLERGQSSYQKQNYRQAFLRLQPIAKSGNSEAQYAVAYMYYYGQGVVEDRYRATLWMKKSAALGNSDAIKALSMLK